MPKKKPAYTEVTAPGLRGKAFRTDLYDENGAISRLSAEDGSSKVTLRGLDDDDRTWVLTLLVEKGILQPFDVSGRSGLDEENLYLEQSSVRVTDPDQIVLDIQGERVERGGLRSAEVTLDVVVLLPAKILVQENPRPAGRR